MGGGLMQLVAYGAQDIYLTGNPQITFFKVVYRRHTNFSMEAIEQTWSGNSDANGRCTATISRNGELVSRMYIEVSNTGGDITAANNISNPGAHFITDVELEIGGQKIDKHTGQWLETWAELTEQNSTGRCMGQDVGESGTVFQTMSCMGGVEEQKVGSRAYVPLQFWFCRNPGLALPLIALQYHEVKVVLNHVLTTTWAGQATGLKQQLWCDYIYLDTDERRRFAQVSHEYLIEQVQSVSTTTATADLNFNHPVKELIWTGPNSVFHQGSGVGTGTNDCSEVLTGVAYQLKLNGHDRFAKRNYQYFTRTQIWQHHSGPGGIGKITTLGDNPAASATSGNINDSIAVYSFALKPEEHQPSGTCNFSRIDTAQLVMDVAANLTIFAVNYNVLRIMSGMGGLAYSN